MSAFLPLKAGLSGTANLSSKCVQCVQSDKNFLSNTILPWNTFDYPFITLSSSTTSFLGNLKFVLKATK